MSRLLAGRGRSGVMSAGTTGVGASASSASAAAATASGDGCAGAGAGARGRPDDGRDDCADDEPSEGASDGAGGPSEGAGWPASRGTSSLASAVAGRLWSASAPQLAVRSWIVGIV